MNTRTRSIVIVLSVAATMHAGVLVGTAMLEGSISANAFKSLDADEYYQIATNIADHGRYSQSVKPPLVSDTWRTPGYPMFLASLIVFLGDWPEALIVAQQLLGIINVLLVFLIACKFMSDRRAMIVAFLFLLEPYHLYYSTWLLATTLFLTALLLLWLLWQIAIETRGAGWYLLAGLFAGYLVLVRPVAVLIPAVLAGWITVQAVRRSVGWVERVRRWQGFGWLLAFVVGVVGVVGVWGVRNVQVAGRLALSSQGGVVLAYFKAAEVVLWRQGRASDRYIETSLADARADQPHSVWDEIDRQLRRRMDHLDESVSRTLRWSNLAQGNKTEADTFEISAALTSIGLRYLRESPLATITCCLVRVGSLLAFPLNIVVKPAAGIETTTIKLVAKALPYVLLCGLVLVRLLRGRLNTNAVFFPLAIAAALLLASTPQLDPRFRVPIIPCLIFIALLPRNRHQNVLSSIELT